MKKIRFFLGIGLLFIWQTVFGQSNIQIFTEDEQYIGSKTLTFSDQVSELPITLFHNLRHKNSTSDFLTVKIEIYPEEFVQIQDEEGSVLRANSTFVIPADPNNYKTFYISYLREASNTESSLNGKIIFSHAYNAKHFVEVFLRQENEKDPPVGLPIELSCEPFGISIEDDSGQLISEELNLGVLAVDQAEEVHFFNLISKNEGECKVEVQVIGGHFTLSSSGDKRMNSFALKKGSRVPVKGRLSLPEKGNTPNLRNNSFNSQVKIYLDKKEIKSVKLIYTLDKTTPLRGLLVGIGALFLLGCIAYYIYRIRFRSKSNKGKKTLADEFLLEHIIATYKHEPQTEVQEIVDRTIRSVSSGGGSNHGILFEEFLAETRFTDKEGKAYRADLRNSIKVISQQMRNEDKALIDSYIQDSQENFLHFAGPEPQNLSSSISNKPILSIIDTYGARSVWYYVHLFLKPARLKQPVENKQNIWEEHSYSDSYYPNNWQKEPSSNEDVKVMEEVFQRQMDELRAEKNKLDNEKMQLLKLNGALTEENERLTQKVIELESLLPDNKPEEPGFGVQGLEVDEHSRQIAWKIYSSFEGLKIKPLEKGSKSAKLTEIFTALKQSLERAQEFIEPLKRMSERGNISSYPTLVKHISNHQYNPGKGVVEYSMSQLYPYISEIGIHLEELSQAERFSHLNGQDIRHLSEEASRLRITFLNNMEEGLGIEFLRIPLFSPFQRRWKKDEWVKEIQENTPAYYPNPDQNRLGSDFVYYIKSLGYKDQYGHIKKTEIVVHT